MSKKQTTKKKVTPAKNEQEDIDLDLDFNDPHLEEDSLSSISEGDDDDIDTSSAPRKKHASKDDFKALNPEVALRANPQRGSLQKEESRLLDGISSLKELETPETATKIWKKLEKLALESQPIPYAVNHHFSLDDLITHPTFGLGYVVEINSNTKITVLFEIGLKRLIHNINP